MRSLNLFSQYLLEQHGTQIVEAGIHRNGQFVPVWNWDNGDPARNVGVPGYSDNEIMLRLREDGAEPDDVYFERLRSVEALVLEVYLLPDLTRIAQEEPDPFFLGYIAQEWKPLLPGMVKDLSFSGGKALVTWQDFDGKDRATTLQEFCDAFCGAFSEQK